MTENVSNAPVGGEMLLYQTPAGEVRVDCLLQDETIWLTQKAIAALFGAERSVVTKHLGNIFKEGELVENSVCAKFAQTAADGKNYATKYYNLDAIIAVGYRVNSYQATQFRIWATKTLKEFITKGFVLDDDRIVIVETKGQEDLDVPPKMVRLKQWCEDMSRVQSEVTYEFVFVDDEGFKKYCPKTFKSMMDGFTLYKSDDEHR